MKVKKEKRVHIYIVLRVVLLFYHVQVRADEHLIIKQVVTFLLLLALATPPDSLSFITPASLQL